MKERSPFIDSAVTFRNSEGLEAQGVLLRLSREAIVFEVYNPYSIVQMSEVLREVRIRRGDRDVYTGRAAVEAIISTGLMLVVSAGLRDPWSDTAFLAPGPALQDEVREFVSTWAASNHLLRPGYVRAVNNLRGFLQEFSRWLQQGEATHELAQAERSAEQTREFLGDVEAAVTPQLRDLLGEFESASAEVEKADLAVHKAYARREIHPVALCSPFVHRSYTKPLGYAGDYEMVNMMFRDPWEGESAYAKVINAFLLHGETARAHRCRIDRLTKLLEAEAARQPGVGNRFRVLNVGCGPAIEVQRFFRDCPGSDRVAFELLDFNQETLDHARACVEPLRTARAGAVPVAYTRLSVHELLKAAARGGAAGAARYEMVYCAGLFDYLGDRVCSRLLQLFYDWTVPGGLVVATNVHPRNPMRGMMEHIQDWSLILRDEQQMLALAPNLGLPHASPEQTGVNVFLEIRKPEQGG